MSGEQWWPTDKFELELNKYRQRFGVDDASAVADAVSRCFMDLTDANKKLPGNSCMSISELHEVLFPLVNPSKADLGVITNYMKQHNKKANGCVDRVNHSGVFKWRMPPKK